MKTKTKRKIGLCEHKGCLRRAFIPYTPRDGHREWYCGRHFAKHLEANRQPQERRRRNK